MPDTFIAVQFTIVNVPGSVKKTNYINMSIICDYELHCFISTH